MLNLDTLTEAQISQALKNESVKTFDIPHQFENTHYRKASVLIPFVRIDNAWHILFIRRAESDKDRHSGQVAFVGGIQADSVREKKICLCSFESGN